MRILYSFLLLSALLSCSSEKEKETTSDIAIIPNPSKLVKGIGAITLDKSTSIYTEEGFELASDFLRSYLQKGAGWELMNATEEKAEITIKKDTSLTSEGYSLSISEQKITIKAAEAAGAFYAVQSLRQLLPPSLERLNSMPISEVEIPLLEIKDAPQFSYRGMHLDVGRHFFPKEFIKKYIANMSLLKMNYFHWHLTEDQGWRIEIKKYPKLTTHAAFRAETLVGHYSDQPHQYDGERYGGFYTQEEIKEIVAFAAKHNVTIIPEIEMPGHAQAAVSAYPEFGCTGEQVPVATKWGVFENIYCPNQKTFAFLKDVLTEVMDLFPGEYIHIGGDEAPKSQWEKCDHCQKLIKDLNLKDEHGLQSYFIKEMEAFINSKGKKIIGWDEILEGGLAPNATVMSWRGTQGGIEAAKAEHDVIMTPTSHAYFDYYQADHPDEPLAIGGFLPLKRVFSFNPLPKELTSKESKYILGAQGNVWTEYMKTAEQVEYMAFPRMLAMSEVVWSGPSNNVENDYPKFLSRVEPFMARMDALGINYANHLYDLEGRVIKKEGQVSYELKSPLEGKEIRYTVNASEEKIYDGPIAINESSQLEAYVIEDGNKIGRPFSESLRYHRGVTADIALNVAPNKAYDAGGKEALINGVMGSDSRYGDKEWLGFWGDDVEVNIDLSEAAKLNFVTLRFYHAPGQWIYAPKEVNFTGILSDGTSTLSKIELLPQKGNLVSARFDFRAFPNRICEKIILKIPSFGTIAEGNQGAGNKAWTFIDEIVIE